MRTILGEVARIAGKTLLLVCLCVLALQQMHAQVEAQGEDLDQYKRRFTGSWWYSQPSGYFDGQNHEGQFDLTKDFHFGSYSTFTGTFDWHFKGKHHLILGMSPVSYSNTVTLARTVMFQGETYNVGTRATSDIRSLAFSPGYQWDFIRRNRGYVALETGTTIVDITQNGSQSLFFQAQSPCAPANVGLTTALGTLNAGFIVVGNGPTTDGTAATAMPGSLIVINNKGGCVQSITDPSIQYPWDMALVDKGDSAIAFITNALTGTVTRLNFSVSAAGLTLKKATTIASGYVHQGDPIALFVAPTGLVYDSRLDVLYVASTGDNAVYAVHDAAGRQTSANLGQLIYKDNLHLHGALAMILAPNGHFLVTNNDTVNANPNMPSEIVEFTVDGQFVKEISVDPAFGGSFGLAARAGINFPILAAVDDNIASLFIWHLSEGQN